MGPPVQVMMKKYSTALERCPVWNAYAGRPAGSFQMRTSSQLVKARRSPRLVILDPSRNISFSLRGQLDRIYEVYDDDDL